MPTDVIDSSSSQRARLDGAKTDVIAYLGVRDTTSDIWRAGDKFDLSAYAGTETVTNVEFDVTMGANGGGSGTYRIGPYNGDGLSDIDSDSGSDMYSRCDLSSDNYVTGESWSPSTAYNYPDLGAQAESDIEAALGADFCMAYQQVEEDTAFEEVRPDRDTDSNPAQLTITYSAGGGGGGSIINQMQGNNLGSDLFNGTLQ